MGNSRGRSMGNSPRRGNVQGQIGKTAFKIDLRRGKVSVRVKIAGRSLHETMKLWFIKELLISQNRHRQSTVKFHKHHNEVHILTDTHKQVLLRCVRPWTLREAPPKKADNWSGIKNGKASREISLSWYQSIDKNHFWTTSESMSNLKLVCQSRSQEKWAPKKISFQTATCLSQALPTLCPPSWRPPERSKECGRRAPVL
jgi:hypothetical protein